MDILQPTLHKPIKLGTRVRVDPNILGKAVFGKVVGIAFKHVVFGYIVLLDKAIEDEYGIHEAISVVGSALVDEVEHLNNNKL